MNENLSKLTNALRSGEYDQIYGQLSNGDNYFCVMGVACEVYRQEHPEDSDWIDNEFIMYDGDGKIKDICFGVPPLEVLEWYGLDDLVGGASAELNDEHDYDFHDLADWLETPESRRVRPEDLPVEEIEFEYA